MKPTLPRFKYHPDPLATGAVEPSDATCECCGKAPGYIYTASVYAVEEVESVCPWCIADGGVARKFDAHLSDDHPLRSAGLPAEVVEEVTRRTPGYISWQQDDWMVCCDDACEFHGDAPAAELRALDADGLAALSSTSRFAIENLPEILRYYEPSGSPAFYKFVCRHCSRIKYGGDCD